MNTLIGVAVFSLSVFAQLSAVRRRLRRPPASIIE